MSSVLCCPAGLQRIYLFSKVEMSDCLSTFQQAAENIHTAIITYALDVRGLATLSRRYVDVWVKRWKKTTTLAESLQSSSIQLWDSTRLADTGSRILWIKG